ncbi:hypothetical protein HYFRA_00008312 [Hymenoscyphus fraxineus]|uniref:Uncharacterized protein n=1 Tax=Hymenoscyphus fraxineus TaxID=746836 RepID=A0A9N9KML0_9HELO|nr:hypothetical protein HYFRA_00008312 [Hymenoscyphus fraxineus]
MRSFSLQALAIFFASASVASASLNVHNFCSYPIYIKQSHNGGCNKGTNTKTCDGASPPFVVKAGATYNLPMFTDKNSATSVKIAREQNMGKVTQFEYTPTDNTMFWDLSDIDGAGAARTGSPFKEANLKVSPVGKDLGAGTCKAIKCKKNEVCKDAYQFPDQTATHSCPMSTTTFTLDICVPDAQFTRREVEVGFSA